METITKAIEMHHLVPDETLPAARLTRIRGIILMPEIYEIDEAERLQVTAADSALNFLKAPEDTYTLADGRSFHDQREFMSQESGYQTSVTRKI